MFTASGQTIMSAAHDIGALSSFGYGRGGKLKNTFVAPMPVPLPVTPS